MYAIPFLLSWRLHQFALTARRKQRTGAYYAWSALAAVAGTLALLLCAFLVLVFVYAKMWWMAPLAVAGLAMPVIGPAFVRHVCARFGWYRVAYYVGYLSRPEKDVEAFGLVCASWALAGDPSGAGVAWIDRKRATRIPLGDGEVVATAFIVAARGDADAARALLRSSLLLVEEHPAVRELAGEWLACDAAERGAWSELADDAVHARYPASPLTWFLEGVALRRVGSDSAPGVRELYARWLMAPHRRATRPLMLAADPPAPTTDTATVTSDGAPLPRAIAAHLALSLGTADALAAAVRAWDAALTDGATHSWLSRRALELDAPLGAVDKVLREVASAVTTDLARIADAAKLGTPAAHGPVGDALGRHLRHGRLDVLEQAFTRWAERRTTGDVHPAIDEWREFIALQAAYTATVEAGGLEVRRLAFPHVFTTGSNMAAWLWNSRSEYVISHAISKWLLAEALIVGDTEAIELGHRNCGLYVPTRVGDPAKTNRS